MRRSILSSSAAASLDCVLVNLQSSGFDGVELCRRLNVYRGVAPVPGTEVATFYIVGARQR